jgi:hypothetical protein
MDVLLLTHETRTTISARFCNVSCLYVLRNISISILYKYCMFDKRSLQLDSNELLYISGMFQCLEFNWFATGPLTFKVIAGSGSNPTTYVSETLLEGQTASFETKHIDIAASHSSLVKQKIIPVSNSLR